MTCGGTPHNCSDSTATTRAANAVRRALPSVAPGMAYRRAVWPTSAGRYRQEQVDEQRRRPGDEGEVEPRSDGPAQASSGMRGEENGAASEVSSDHEVLAPVEQLTDRVYVAGMCSGFY